MNNLYQQLNPQQNNIGNLFRAVKNSNNPTQMLQNIAMNNPQFKSVMNMVQNSGKSPKDLFYEMAKQKGVDPNQILNMLR